MGLGRRQGPRGLGDESCFFSPPPSQTGFGLCSNRARHPCLGLPLCRLCLGRGLGWGQPAAPCLFHLESRRLAGVGLGLRPLSVMH